MVAEAPVGHLAIVFIGGVVGRIRDLTSRVRSEVASLKKLQIELNASQERFRAIAHYSPNAIFYSDHHNRILYWNPAAEKIFGYTQQEAIGQPAHMLVPERLRTAYQDRFRQFMDTKAESFPGKISEYVAQRKNGEELPTEIAFSAWKSDGETFFSCSISDITKRKRAEAALKTEKDNLKAVFASSPVGMLLLDDDMVIADANAVMANMLAKEPAQVLQQRAGAGLGCVHSMENKKGCGSSPVCPACPLRNAILDLLQTGQPVHSAEFQLTLLIDGREQRPWLLVSAEQALLDGRRHVVVAIVDITERKQTEENIRASEARFRSYFDLPLHGIAITSLDKGWLEANDRLCSILGYSRDEILRMTSAE